MASTCFRCKFLKLRWAVTLAEMVKNAPARALRIRRQISKGHTSAGGEMLNEMAEQGERDPGGRGCIECWDAAALSAGRRPNWLI